MGILQRVGCALLALNVLALDASATSIVILRSPNKIYLGADSRRSYRYARGSYASSVCKIVPAGRFFFVASGLTYANHQEVATMGAEAGRSSLTVEQALETFRTRVAGFLREALAAREQLESSTRAGLVLEAAYLGLDANAATVSVEWFRVAGSAASPKITTDRQTFASQSPGYDFIFLGNRQSIDQYLRGTTRPIRSDAEALQWIDRLIGLEIASSPSTTAAPIDALRLTGDGAQWLVAKPGCEMVAPVN